MRFLEKYNYYIHHLKICNSKLNELKKLEGGCILFWWSDFIRAYLFHGCYINHYIHGEFYKLRKSARKASLTYPRFERIMLSCNKREYWHYLTNKRDFNNHFSEFINRDWIYVPDVSFDNFYNFITTHDNILVKPNEMYQGVGIHKLEFNNPVNKSEIFNLYSNLSNQNCLLEEFIKQHNTMDPTNGFCKSVNTIRLYTFIDSQKNVRLLKAILRAGVGNSIVDNFHAGGCIYEVDLDTGVVDSKGMQRGPNETRLSHKIHPGTNTIMIGYKIPNWQILIEKMQKAAQLLPECRYIGWDIAITENDIELIEGNHDADYELLEFIGEKGWWKIIKQYL